MELQTIFLSQPTTAQVGALLHQLVAHSLGLQSIVFFQIVNRQLFIICAYLKIGQRLSETQETQTWAPIFLLETLKKDNLLVYAPTVEDIYEGQTVSQEFDFDGLEHEMEGKFRKGK